MTDFRRGIGVFLFSAAFLLLELSLSRIFSVISFYHYAYMAISIALFGMAFGGVLVYLKPSLFPKGRTDEQLAILAGLYAAFTIVAIALISNIDFDPFLPLAKTSGRLVWLILTASVPFLIAGVILSQVFARYRESIGTMYAANLAGSAVGCLLVIPAMDILGGPTAVIFAAFLAACAAIALQPPSNKTRSWGYAFFGLILLALTVINPSTGNIRLHYSKGTNLDDPEILYSKWNSFSRILVIKDYPKYLARKAGAKNLLDPKEAFRFYNWGLSSKYDGPPVDGLSLLIDDLAGSPLIKFDGDLSKLDFLRYDITSAGYYLKEGQKPDVLIIGTGGGRDVLTALNFDVGSVTAVEINPVIIDVVQKEFADFTGKPYSQPGVTLYNDEGRNFIARSDKLYDIIQLPLVDTWAATASGAFSLSENNLYTVEAFKEYFDHLKPGGFLAISRYIFDPPTQSLRILSLYREYCEEEGIKHPERKCAVIGFDEYKFNNVGTLIMKKEDLSADEMASLRNMSNEMGFKVLWMPDGGVYPSQFWTPSGGVFPNQFAKLLNTGDFKGFVANYEYDISPSTDNKPFFFHVVRPGEFLKALSMTEATEQPHNFMAIFTLMMLLFILVAFLIVCIIIPLFLKLRSERTRLDAGRTRILIYFSAIGAAFMLFEMAMVQKFILFLGRPIFSIAIVLFSLLLFTGVGAWVSDRMHRRYGAMLRPVLFILLLCAVIIGFAFILTPMFNLLIGLSIFWRCLLSVILLAPLGLLLGFPFPLGVRMLGDDGASLIPYAYGLNGAMGVLGSVGALILALMFGFQFNIFLGVFLYIIAASMSLIKFPASQN